jgi:hypothetical protein
MGDYSPSTFYSERSIKSVMVYKYSPHCQVIVQSRRHPKYRLYQGKKRTVVTIFVWYFSWISVSFRDFFPSLTLLVGGIFHVFLTRSVNILVLFFLSCLYEYIVDIIFSKILFFEWVIVVLRQSKHCLAILLSELVTFDNMVTMSVLY